MVFDENNRALKSGFDLFAKSGFDVNIYLGYPNIHAYVSSFDINGYYIASAWIQIVTRQEIDCMEIFQENKL